MQILQNSHQDPNVKRARENGVHYAQMRAIQPAKVNPSSYPSQWTPQSQCPRRGTPQPRQSDNHILIVNFGAPK